MVRERGEREWAMDTSRYNQKGRLNFHQSVRMCMKSAIISAGEGERGRRGERSVSYSCWNEIPLKRPVAAAKGSWIGRWDAVISIINSSGSIINWAEELPQLLLRGAAQAAPAIKHIIIQWIIRCNQSALKHHKSKPAEPKRSGRLDKGQHRLSTQ